MPKSILPKTLEQLQSELRIKERALVQLKQAIESQRRDPVHHISVLFNIADDDAQALRQQVLENEVADLKEEIAAKKEPLGTYITSALSNFIGSFYAKPTINKEKNAATAAHIKEKYATPEAKGF